jgi:hypothetical protein
MKGQNLRRILALHVTSGGFAYTALDGPGQLTDWGIKRFPKGQKNQNCLAAIEHLIIQHDPHAIVFEDTDEIGCRRSARVKHLLRMISKLADRVGVDTYCYPWQTVFEVFRDGKPDTRHDLALMIAVILPAIRKRLPPKRKAWLPQDPRQALFDASALGITFYSVNDG